MAAKSVLFLICFFLLNISSGWCENATEKTAEPVKASVEENSANATADQPDPYKNVTWDSVTSKNNEQAQTATVYSPRTRTGDADFVSVSSTGTGAGVNSGVVVVAPTEKKSKRWFFW